MAQFMLTYVGGNHDMSPEDQKTNYGEWMAWMKNLGPAMVVPQQPLKPAKSVSSNGVSDANGPRITGYSIVEAADEDAAIAMAQSCPFLAIDGEVTVAELISMPG